MSSVFSACIVSGVCILVIFCFALLLLLLLLFPEASTRSRSPIGMLLVFFWCLFFGKQALALMVDKEEEEEG